MATATTERATVRYRYMVICPRGYANEQYFCRVAPEDVAAAEEYIRRVKDQRNDGGKGVVHWSTRVQIERFIREIPADYGRNWRGGRHIEDFEPEEG